MTTAGKTNAELTLLANEALRSQAGCETASIPCVQVWPNARGGRNWEIPNVVLGDSLISDVKSRRHHRSSSVGPAVSFAARMNVDGHRTLFIDGITGR